MQKEKEHFFKKFKCTNVLHIGGHSGQEASLYKELGLSFTFIEPMPEYARALRHGGHSVIEAAITKLRGRTSFYVGHESERSSLKETTPDVTTVAKKIQVNTLTLADVQDGFDGLSIDAQGETIDILRSGRLDFKVIVCEVSNAPRYAGEGSRQQVAAFLDMHGYRKVAEFRHRTLDIFDDVFVK